MGSRGVRVGKADGQHGVGAKRGLVGRAIKINHESINGGLIKRVQAFERAGDFHVDMFNRLQHALATVFFLVTVAQFHGFIFAGASARRNGSAPYGCIGKSDLTFDGWKAARVKNLAGMNMLNG